MNSPPTTNRWHLTKNKRNMKNIIITLAAFAISGFSFAQGKSVTNDLCNTGSIIVEPNAGLPQKHFDKLIGEHNGKAKRIGQSNMFTVDLPGHSEKGVIARLKHNPHFKFAEQDCLVPSEFIPNDPNYLSAWYLSKIGADTAWDTAQGSGITIAILDSGIDASHPDLSSRLVPGWNFYSNNSDTADVYGHGTKVAGSAAAITNNGIGGSGVAGQARIMPIRVSGTDGYATWSGLASGFIYAADHGARVANASFLGLTDSSSTRSAAQYLKDKGGLAVVSGGNTGALQGYAVTTSMISVAATDSNDMRTSWSSYGNYISVAAPGASIFSTTVGGGYGYVSGTSFSSPITAGVVALMMSANPNLSNIEIERLLFSTAVDLGDMGRDPYYGYGRVNAVAAVEAAKAATSTLDIQPPSVAITSPQNDTIATGLVPVSITATDNVAVSRVELRVNSTIVAVDSSQPFAFSWDSTGVPNGLAKLTAYAYDSTGNAATSSPVTVTVSNGTTIVVKDTTAPVVSIVRPVAGSVSGNVNITANATDDSAASGITMSIYVDDSIIATGAGGTVSANWNTNPNKITRGNHTIKAIAKDAAGNTSMASVIVNVAK